MLGTIVSLISIGWAVYGIYVFWLWRKIAKKADAVLDETKEKYRELDEDFSSLREPNHDANVEESDLVAKMSPASRALYEQIMAELRDGDC